MIQDRLMCGAIAGIAGAIVQNLYAIVGNSIGYSGPFYVDYGKIILFYGNLGGLLANILGFIGHLIWDIILGIIFAHFLKQTSNRYLFSKSILYGLIVWFLIKMSATLFKIPDIINVFPQTVGFFMFGSILYGICIGWVLSLLEHSKQVI